MTAGTMKQAINIDQTGMITAPPGSLPGDSIGYVHTPLEVCTFFGMRFKREVLPPCSRIVEGQDQVGHLGALLEAKLSVEVPLVRWTVAAVQQH